MDASIFKNSIGTHLNYLKIAYGFLIEAYQELVNLGYDASLNNENKIRDDLVKIAKKKKNYKFPFRWITEFHDIEEKNRIDIDLAIPCSLIDDSHAIKIECKKIGEDKYIDTKKSFSRKRGSTNGIMSFITGKYSPNMPLAGMIGFVKKGNIQIKIENIKKRINIHSDIITIQNLLKIKIIDNFEYSYHSKHKRSNNFRELDIYHLFFDFT